MMPTSSSLSLNVVPTLTESNTASTATPASAACSASGMPSFLYVSEKATFRSAWSDGRRCVIPAIGYYEWQKTQSGKQPYFAGLADESPLFFGGLYEPARESVCASCTIITLQASNAMAPLHHLMPLMFNDPEAWLEGNSFEGHLDDLSWHAVGKTVNNTRNQGIELIQYEK